MTTALDGDDVLRGLADRQAISEALVAYAHGVDLRDQALILSAYHADALDVRAGFAGTPASFVEWLLPRLAAFVTTHHAIGTVRAELVGDFADVHSYFDTRLVRAEADGSRTVVSTSGRYIDRFERRDGRWGISSRRVEMHQRHESPLAEHVAGMPTIEMPS